MSRKLSLAARRTDGGDADNDAAWKHSEERKVLRTSGEQRSRRRVRNKRVEWLVQWFSLSIDIKRKRLTYCHCQWPKMTLTDHFSLLLQIRPFLLGYSCMQLCSFHWQLQFPTFVGIYNVCLWGAAGTKEIRVQTQLAQPPNLTPITAKSLRSHDTVSQFTLFMWALGFVMNTICFYQTKKTNLILIRIHVYFPWFYIIFCYSSWSCCNWQMTIWRIN